MAPAVSASRGDPRAAWRLRRLPRERLDLFTIKTDGPANQVAIAGRSHRGTPNLRAPGCRAADVLVELQHWIPLGRDDEDFRISIAGAQEKTALLRRDGRWFKPIGTTATTHILKPQIGRLPNGLDLSNSVENEYFCLGLMAALGLPSCGVEMADFGAHRALVVERFDRLWTRDGRLLRIPQEDCCQALSVQPALKSESDGGAILYFANPAG